MDENGEETHAVEAEELVSELKDTNGVEKASEVEKSPEGGVGVVEKKAKGRGRSKASKPDTEEQANEKSDAVARKREKKEPSTPIVERPARERKSIDRFAASVEKEKVRELKIEKGAGACLKDIPNVVFKLSKRKGSDEAVQLLHKLLYGKRIKPHNAKPNILQFSGYVWSTNQEKDKAKYKEKLEKCVKENLVQISDILDLNLPKAASKKEDLVLKLLEFLESPHKTSEKLLEEVEQKSKVKKRKKTPIKGAKKKVTGQTPRKKQKREGKPSKVDKIPVEEVEEDEEAEEEEEDVEEEAEEEPLRKKRTGKDSDDDYDSKSKNSKKRKRKPSKKQLEEEEEEEEEAETKETKSKPLAKSPKKKVAAAKPAKSPVQSPSKDSKKGDTDSSKVFLRKKKKEEPTVEESPKKEKVKGGNQANAKEETKPKLKVKVSYPSDEELRAAICELLQDVDFSTVTFTDVVKQLGKKFDVDLSQNKAHVKQLIQEEISKIVDEDEGEGEDDNGVDENAEKDKEDSDAGDVNNQVAED